MRALQQTRYGADSLSSRQRRLRLRSLRDAALLTAAPVPAEPQSVIDLLARVVEQAATAVGGIHALLVLADDSAWHALLPGTRQSRGVIRVERSGLVHRVQVHESGAISHVLRTGEAVWVADTEGESPFGPFPALLGRGVRGFGVLPLLAAGRVLGGLQVGFPAPLDLTEEDQAALELIASYGAVSLERLHLVLSERRRAVQAEHLAATLARVGAALDLESAVEALLRGALDLLEGDHGVAYVISQEGDDEQPLVVDLYRDGQEQQQMTSSVQVPIEAGGRHIGRLQLEHHLADYFEPPDLVIAEALAAQAGAAIDRARLEAARRRAERARLETEQQLERSEAEAAALRELHRLKDEFLGSISHEFRTPLTVLHGYAQRLSQRARMLEPAAVEGIAATMVASSAQLSRLVDDLLDFARIEGGELHLVQEDFDLVPLLRTRAAELRGQEGAEHLEAHLPEKLLVRADRARTAHVIKNLLDNAIKYAPSRDIVLSVTAGRDVARVEVADTGPGIPSAEQPRIWERFYRGSAVAGLNIVRGSGIGLAVVKALVEAQGGRVGLDSAVGRGSRFWFELPFAIS